MSRRAGGFLASAALIAAVTVVARAVGFGRWAVFSSSVNAGCVGGAYTSANILPNILFEVVAGGALAGAVVPLLAGAVARGDRERVDAVTSALLGWALLVLVPVSVLLAVLAGPVSRALIDGDGCAGQQQLTARMITVFAPQIALYGIGVVLTGVLQAHRRFFWPAFVPLLSSVVVIVAYRMFAVTDAGRSDDAQALPGTAEAWLLWGTTAGVAAMTLPLLLPVARAGIRLRPRLTFPPGVAARGRALAAAGIGALLAQQLSVLVGVVLANHADARSYAVFTYTQAVYLLPYAVLAVPLATSAFPRLAERASAGDTAGFARDAASTTRAVVVAGCLSAAGLAAAAPGVGAFFAVLDAGDVASMAPALVVMAPGVLGFALVAHVGRALYALERGRSAAVATSAGWLAVAAASLVAVPLAGPVEGLAWGTAVGMSVAGVLLLLALARAAGAEAVRGVPRAVLTGIVAAALAAGTGHLAAARVVDHAGGGTGAAVLAMGAAATVCLVVFAAVLAVTDRHDLAETLRRLARRSGPTQRRTG
jgi:putative peptidoglycan lipid II flippase